MTIARKVDDSHDGALSLPPVLPPRNKPKGGLVVHKYSLLGDAELAADEAAATRLDVSAVCFFCGGCVMVGGEGEIACRSCTVM